MDVTAMAQQDVFLNSSLYASLVASNSALAPATQSSSSSSTSSTSPSTSALIAQTAQEEEAAVAALGAYQYTSSGTPSSQNMLGQLLDSLA